MRHLLLPSLFASMLSVAQAAPMPSVDEPLRTGQQASGDAAVVIGIGDYQRLGPGFKVDYAEEDALAFNDFLIYTRGVPHDRVYYLDPRAGKEEISKAFKKAAGQAKGTLWFYFAGHGAADPKTREQVLLPGDLPSDPELQPMRMLPISDLQKIARNSKAKHSIFVIDACHAQLESTRFAAPIALASVQPKDQMVIWTAAQAGQLSKPLPSTKHGAFTYAVLRALRGDADGEISGVKDGIVDLNEAEQFVNQFLKKQKLFSSQTPQLNRPQKLSFELSDVKHARLDVSRPVQISAVTEVKDKPEEKAVTSEKVTESADAMFHTGKAYYLQGDYLNAAKWFVKSAYQGHADAQYHLGKLYETGKGVPQNYKNAVEWYIKAAKQGHAAAQGQLRVHSYGTFRNTTR